MAFVVGTSLMILARKYPQNTIILVIGTPKREPYFIESPPPWETLTLNPKPFT